MKTYDQIAVIARTLTEIGKKPEDYVVVICPQQERCLLVDPRHNPDSAQTAGTVHGMDVFLHSALTDLIVMPHSDIHDFLGTFSRGVL